MVAGDPDLDTTEAVLLALDANGADIIELGVPYSDPLADGPVIQVSPSPSIKYRHSKLQRTGGADLSPASIF